MSSSEDKPREQTIREVPVPMWGLSAEADFEKETWTFQMQTPGWAVSAGAYAIVYNDDWQAVVKILQDACDRDWKDETLYQTAVIAANAIYWRDKEIENLKAARSSCAEPVALAVWESKDSETVRWLKRVPIGTPLYTRPECATGEASSSDIPAAIASGALSASERWIPVKEGLPEEGKDVMIYHVLGDRDRPEVPHAYDVGWLLKGRWTFPWDRAGRQFPEFVTHWRELPAAPCSATTDIISKEKS